MPVFVPRGEGLEHCGLCDIPGMGPRRDARQVPRAPPAQSPLDRAAPAATGQFCRGRECTVASLRVARTIAAPELERRALRLWFWTGAGSEGRDKSDNRYSLSPSPEVEWLTCPPIKRSRRRAHRHRVDYAIPVRRCCDTPCIRSCGGGLFRGHRAPSRGCGDMNRRGRLRRASGRLR